MCAWVLVVCVLGYRLCVHLGTGCVCAWVLAVCVLGYWLCACLGIGCVLCY